MASARPPRQARQRSGAASVLVVFAAVVAVGAVVVVAVMSALSGGEARPWSNPATVDGNRLTLTYVDSECQDHEAVDVRETADKVAVTIRTRTWALSCSDVNAQYTVNLRLVEPLGERTLVDGACAGRELAREAVCTALTR